jgi:hypothetical protein
LLRVACGLVLLAGSGVCLVTPAASLGLRHEAGVETKALFAGLADWQPFVPVEVYGGAALSLFQHAGLSRLGLGASFRVGPVAAISVHLAVQHEQWNDWQAGENRVLASLSAEPLAGLRLAAGIAWRVPLFDPAHFGSPFYWQSDAPERNILYRLEWPMLGRGRWQVSGWLSNFDRFTVRNPQQFPFGLDAAVRLSPCLSVSAHAGTAINGLSGLLLSLSELNLEVGVSRAF